jgi:hypothetical protein
VLDGQRERPAQCGFGECGEVLDQRVGAAPKGDLVKMLAPQLP